jgi:putative mRNA 3-end processing factor
MAEITFLGGGREVGRMGIIVDTGNERFLLDYGVNVENMDVPLKPELPPALLLSHTHLDHSGNVPALYAQGWKGRVYATPPTFEISNILLKDSLKVQKMKGMQPAYGLHDVSTLDRKGIDVHFGAPKRIGSSWVSFRDAGHVPGSSSILIESGGKRILYTGDIKFEDTLLMKGAFRNFSNIDVLITESTYSYKNHPPRMDVVKKIRERVMQTVQGGGIAIMPCFAVGRTQEMLLIVSELGFPIHIDGMGISATRASLMHPEFLKDRTRLRNAFGMAHKIRNNRQRENAMKRPGIIITTAGMLNGGPVHSYIKKLHDRPECAMILSGFQIPGTVGRTLLDTGRYIYEDVDVQPRMLVEFMDLSAHCGRDEIINFINEMRPKKTFLVHGERTEEFAKELLHMGFDACAPKNGDRFEV